MSVFFSIAFVNTHTLAYVQPCHCSHDTKFAEVALKVARKDVNETLLTFSIDTYST